MMHNGVEMKKIDASSFLCVVCTVDHCGNWHSSKIWFFSLRITEKLVRIKTTNFGSNFYCIWAIELASFNKNAWVILGFPSIFFIQVKNDKKKFKKKLKKKIEKIVPRGDPLKFHSWTGESASIESCLIGPNLFFIILCHIHQMWICICMLSVLMAFRF